MLSTDDNELLCKAGPGTPGGELIRQYWIPALLSSELPENDGAPLRLRLLGENLIAFRDTSGRVGLFRAFARIAAPRCFSRATRRMASVASIMAGNLT